MIDLCDMHPENALEWCHLLFLVTLQVIDLCDMHPENALEWCHLLFLV